MPYDNDMQVILAKVVSDNPNAPKMRINFEMNGQKYQAGLWPMTRKDQSIVKDKNGNTLYKGMVEVDNYVSPHAQANRQKLEESVRETFGAPSDDDIPF